MVDTRLRPQPVREGLVHRDRVIAQIGESDAPVIAVLAPPGYGKTTLLGQLQDDQVEPTAWLTLDVTDNDPITLLADLTRTMAAAGLLIEGWDSLTAPRVADVLTVGVSTLAGAIDPTVGGVLFLDQIDHLESQSALDVVGELLVRVAGPIQIVIASRSPAGLPLGLLRSMGHVFEITTDDLAMDESEAAAVFTSVGLDVGEGLTKILERTEGWPVGLYLTAIAMNAGAPSPAEPGVHGDDFFLADYLRQELLGSISAATMSFLTRSSILSRLSGPLCDHVLEIEDSNEILAQLERANLLIVPMDRTRTWYRYHSLLQDYLRSELDRQEPEIEQELHRRAATWFEGNGFPDLAIEHVKDAGEIDRFAEMVTNSARRIYAEGRMETISGWLHALEDGKALPDHPELAALGAFGLALEGDAVASERFGMSALTDDLGHPVDDGLLGPFALLLRSHQVLRGPEQAREDAQRARAAFGKQVEWIPNCLGAEGFATTAIEGIEAAEVLWTDGLWRSESMQAHPFTTLGLAERALAAIARSEWDEAESWNARAVGLIEDRRIDRYITSGLAFTIAARLSARAGDVSAARGHLASAASVRPRLTLAMPILAVQTLNEMAKAYIEVADMAGARRVSRDAADIVAVRPKLGTIASEHQAIKERLAEMPAGSVGVSSLTTAELRLLPLLVTHLTYPEIGERLFVSRHTVKTQAMSIYRKLGVSSRTGAVEKAREAGLISL
jgi:LuxR family transcriptional regulator, maltose regulon positive regulatory protein